MIAAGIIWLILMIIAVLFFAAASFKPTPPADGDEE